MTQLCSCTHSPGAIGFEAKPMIWPNLRIGSPARSCALRHLVAARNAFARGWRDRRDAAGEFLDRDDDIVFGVEAQARGESGHSAVPSGVHASMNSSGLARARILEQRRRLRSYAPPSPREPVRGRPLRSASRTARCSPMVACIRPGGVISKTARALEMRAHAVENFSAAVEPEMAGSAARENRRRAHRTRVRSPACAASPPRADFRRRSPPASRVEPARGLGRDLAFQRAANEQPLAHVLRRNARDERAVLRLDAGRDARRPDG